MILISLILIILLGLSIINFISKDISILEKIGLSYLIAIGFETILMFFLNILGISFNLLILLFITGFMIIILNLKNYKNILSYISNIKIPKIEIKRINLVWLFFFLIISFLLFGSIAKSLYWPTAAYDNIAGYDLMAKVMANEGEIKNSLFEINDAPILGSAKRIIYPPLVAGSFAIAYLNDLSTSKLMSSLFFLTFVIIFYALLKKYTGSTSSILFTFFLVITPEMFAFTSLSTTNIPTAVYASLAIIYLFVWLDKNEKQYLIISAILMALASWCRSDSIIFSFAGLTIIFFKIIKSKNWSNLVVFSLISFSTFIAWNIYLKLNLNVEQSVFVPYPFFDYSKLIEILTRVQNLIFNLNLFGVTFFAFIVVILLNLKNINKDKFSQFLILTLLSWGFYTFLFYQMDNSKMDPVKSMINASYRRGLFVFVPLIWFYIANNTVVKLTFEKVENYLSGH